MGVRASHVVALIAASITSGCAPVDGDVDLTASADGGAGVAQSVEAVSVTGYTWALPYHGGTGGSPLGLGCSPGDVVVGIYGRQGVNYMEQLGLVCAPLYANGTFGTRYRTGSVGPAGAINVDAQCPRGYAAAALSLRAATYLDTIVAVGCTASPSFARTSLIWVNAVSNGPQGGLAYGDRCPTNYVLTSMTVRGASWIDAEQAFCSYIQP